MNGNNSSAVNPILPISQILPFIPFENHLRVFDMPAVRFIGKSIIDTLHSNPNPCPAFWGEYYAKGYNLVTDSLNHVIPNTLACFYDYSTDTNQYTYMICVACPTGTPVPDGFEYHDVPASLVCHGVTNENAGDPYEEEKIREELIKLGFNLLGPMCEFYPEFGNISFCVLFTCKRIEE